MTQTSNKLFDDFAKLLTNAAGAAQGVRREIDTVMRSQAERILNELDVVSREEFDAVRDMAAKARDENEALEKRIAALEAKLGGKAAPVAKPTRARKAAAKPRAKRTDSK
jgi:BMFP domain-containing protein YqiC